MLDWSIHTHLDDLERAGTPMFTWGGWFDAGTAQGVLHRFTTLSNPQKAILGPWSHGGGHHASPYQPPDFATTPSREEQLFESLCYFDHYLKGRDNGTPEKELIYYTLGEETWKTTDVWPPPGFDTSRYYFSENESLASEPPSSASGSDNYTVDFEVTTGDVESLVHATRRRRCCLQRSKRCRYSAPDLYERATRERSGDDGNAHRSFIRELDDRGQRLPSCTWKTSIRPVACST